MHIRSTLTAVLGVIGVASGHSWVEQAQVIENGVYVGDLGFTRIWGLGLGDPTFRIPGSSAPKITSGDLLCHPEERTPVQKGSGAPRLKASSGDYVALKYRENGHTTTSYRSNKVGMVYMYGTTNPSETQTLVDVLGWTAEAPLDKGRLLASQSFDDGRCYEPGATNERNRDRAGRFPNDNQGQKWIWCENDLRVPPEAPDGLLTVYWVWNFTEPNGADEFYSSCMDFDIIEKPAVKRTANASPKPAQPLQDSNTKALPDYIERAGIASAPGSVPPSDDKPPATSALSSSSSAPTSSATNSQTTRPATPPLSISGFLTSYLANLTRTPSATSKPNPSGRLTITLTEVSTVYLPEPTEA